MQNFIIVVKSKNALTAKGEFDCIHKNKLFENEIAAALEKEKAIKEDKQCGDEYEYEIIPVWKPDEEPTNADSILLIEKQIKETIRLEFDLIHNKLDQLIKQDT